MLNLSVLFFSFSIFDICVLFLSSIIFLISFSFFLILTQGYVYWFERQKHWCGGKKSFGCLLYVLWSGIKITAYVCALTGEGTCSLLVYGMMLHPTWPPGYILCIFLNKYEFFCYLGKLFFPYSSKGRGICVGIKKGRICSNFIINSFS